MRCCSPRRRSNSRRKSRWRRCRRPIEAFRKSELYFEDVVTADYDSYEKATIDGDGALVLAGVFKTDDMQVKYRIRYVQNNKVWKLLGINVDATKK